MKVAILLLKLEKIQEFEDIIKQYNIDIFDLYSEKNEYNEKIDNSQSKLSIACRCNDLSDYERNYVITLYNVILGGGCDSKLFKEVREKN